MRDPRIECKLTNEFDTKRLIQLVERGGEYMQVTGYFKDKGKRSYTYRSYPGLYFFLTGCRLAILKLLYEYIVHTRKQISHHWRTRLQISKGTRTE